MTKVSHVGPILGVALFALSACQPAGQTGSTAKSEGDAQALSTADVRFVNAAGTSGLVAVTFAQLAKMKATDPAVRHLAETTIADLTSVDQQLAALAQGIGMTPPTDMDGRHQVLYHQLQAMNGPAFDHAYVDGQLQDLTVAIQAFQAEADSGSKPQLRNFAQQNLPVMMDQLRMAGTIAGL